MISKHKQNLDLFQIVKDYFDKMIEEVTGIKGLILDEETQTIISLIIS